MASITWIDLKIQNNNSVIKNWIKNDDHVKHLHRVFLEFSFAHYQNLFKVDKSDFCGNIVWIQRYDLF